MGKEESGPDVHLENSSLGNWHWAIRDLNGPSRGGLARKNGEREITVDRV